MIADGFSYPLRGERAWVRVALGVLLVPFSYLGVPAFAIVGYYLRVLSTSARGDHEPPAVDDPVRLVLDGLWALLVAATYAVPITIAALVVLAVAAAPGGPGWLLPAIGIVLIGVWYAVVPAALATAAVRDRFAAAFDPRAVGRVVATPTYLLAALASVLVVVVAGAVLAQLTALAPLVGLLVAPPAALYLHLVVCRTTGTAFGVAWETPDRGETGAPAESTT